MEITKIKASERREIIADMLADALDIPDEVKNGLMEMADIQTDIYVRIKQDKALNQKQVERYNDLCYKYFPRFQDGGEFTKEEPKKKAMLSQPMAGKREEEIRETRERAIRILEGLGYEVVNTLFTDEWYSDKAMKERDVRQKPLCYLAKSLENMSMCDAAFFCKGWDDARGCRLEHDAAKQYGLTILYEED